MIVVDARLQSRNYTDKEGNKRHAVELNVDNAYFGGSKRDCGNSNQIKAGGGYQGGFTPPQGGYTAPQGNYGAPSYAAPQGGYGGYSAPASTPASDFAMLEDDDAQLPF